MDLTALVDVAIGLTLIYLGASLFVTIANEYVGQLFKLRSKQLKADFKNLLNGDSATDPDVLRFLRANPAFAPFLDGGMASGTYVDPNLVARQLVGGLRKGAAGMATMTELLSAIDSMRDCRLKTQVQALSQAAGNELDKFVENVSNWVDQSLTMMGEGYKKRMQLIGLGLGFVVAAGLNLDTITITSHLYRDKEARTAVSLLASDFVQRTSPETWERCMRLTATERAQDKGCAGITSLLDGMQLRDETLGVLPMGWKEGFSWARFWDRLWSTAFFGWLLTALSTSLGATFWFDLLSKLVNVRHGMKKPVVAERQP